MASTDDPRQADPSDAPADHRPANGESAREWAESADEQEVRAGTGTRVRDAWSGLCASRRRFVALGVALTVIGTVIAVWFALSATVNKPNWRDMAFEVPNEQVVRVRFEVTKPPDMTAVCTLLAQQTNHGVVGRTTLTIPPADQRTTWHEAQIRTTSLATIGTVRTCHEQ